MLRIIKRKKNKKGFALLFSVLISSLLLTVGLSIFSIALKELAISTATRQSIHAFYAADSGREYTLYRDLVMGNAITLDLSSISAQVRLPELNTLSVDSTNSDGPNFYVEITKNWVDVVTKTQISTNITSYGHDSAGGDRVERAIFQSY